jgi:[protein-PII] uridylyltransferase
MLESRRQEALRLLRLHGLRDEAREALWATLDVVYFMRHDAADIAWHTRHLHHRVDARDPVVRARPTESDEGLEVMVYCPDAPDLFARICGFFDAQNLSIQDARIHTTRSGHALDTFVVVSDEAITAWRDRIGFIEHQLAQCLSSSELQTASNSPTRGRPSRQSRLFPISPSVHLRPDERGEWWILSVSASDRTGLLHAIALCFARHGVHLHMAKVMTLGERVEDTFLVAGDIFGHPLRQADFERDLLAVLA